MNNTKIKLNYDGVDYVLEYNKAAIKVIEKNGFDINSFLEKPMSNIDLAFQGAFIKNHPKVSLTTIDEIFQHCPNKQDLVGSLYTMISECYEALFNVEEGKDDSKNITWETVKM